MSAVTLSRSPRRTVAPAPFSCEARPDKRGRQRGLGLGLRLRPTARVAIWARVTLALSACDGVDTFSLRLQHIQEVQQIEVAAGQRVPVDRIERDAGAEQAAQQRVEQGALAGVTLARRGPAVMQAPVAVQAALAPAGRRAGRQVTSRTREPGQAKKVKVMSDSSVFLLLEQIAGQQALQRIFVELHAQADSTRPWRWRRRRPGRARVKPSRL